MLAGVVIIIAPGAIITHLCWMLRIVQHIKPLPRDCRVKQALNISKVPISLGAFGVDDTVFDAVGDVLIGRFATSSLCELSRMRLGLLLLHDLCLSRRHSVVSSMLVRSCRHHRACKDIDVNNATTPNKRNCDDATNQFRHDGPLQGTSDWPAEQSRGTAAAFFNFRLGEVGCCSEAFGLIQKVYLISGAPEAPCRGAQAPGRPGHVPVSASARG